MPHFDPPGRAAIREATLNSAALALLIGLSALATRLLGRPGDAITFAITTTVVMVLADVSPHNAWQHPIPVC